MASESNGSASPGMSWIERAEAPWYAQATALYDGLEKIAADAGGLPSLLRLHLYQQDKRLFPVLESIRVKREGGEPAPSCALGLGPLRNSRLVRYEFDGVGISQAGAKRYGERRVVYAGPAGRSASHYSQFARVGPYVFVAGVIPINPDTMTPVQGFEDIESAGRFLQRGRSHPDARTGPIAAQTWYIYQRILGALQEIGIAPDQIIAANVFLSRRGDTADFLRVHDRIFNETGPALNLCYVDEVGHRGNRVEIEVTAVDGLPLGRGGSRNTVNGPPPISRGGELAFASDVLGLDASGALVSRRDDLTLAQQAIYDREVQSRPEQRVQDAPDYSAQLIAALSNLCGQIEESGLSPAAIGHLWVRLVRPVGELAVEPIVSSVLGTSDLAITVTNTFAIPQSDMALVSVSAIFGGLDTV